jgi:hypothetical protein
MNVPLQKLFLVDKDFCEPAIYVRSEAYNFPVDLDIIKMVGKDKSFDKDEEYLAEHLSHVIEIAEVFG